VRVGSGVGGNIFGMWAEQGPNKERNVA